MNFLTGQILPFDKPLNMTSFQLVAKVRWLISQAMGGKKIKVGHAGTLDPLATGVLILCTGRATKRIEALQSGVKEYIATLRLGATTPSFDLEHEIDQTYPTEHITREDVERVLTTFVGEIMQVPPVFSACKVEGKRAYDLARMGQKAEEVQLKAKPLRIDEIELLEADLGGETPSITIRVVCSKGTYIRAWHATSAKPSTAVRTSRRSEEHAWVNTAKRTASRWNRLRNGWLSRTWKRNCLPPKENV